MNNLIAGRGAQLCACLILLAACAAGDALAEADDGQWYLSGMASYIDDDIGRQVDDEVAGGQIGIGYALSKAWNLEFYAGGASLDGPGEQTHLFGGADLQLLLGRANRVTPYLFAGIGYMEVNPEVGSTEQGETYAGGGGFLFDMFGDSKVALRLEYRYRVDDILTTDLDDEIVSLGLHIPFGGRAAPPAPAPEPEPVDPDGDGDGVPDSRDRCLGTPAGVSVDPNGCPLDDDADGVPNHVDECPGTFAGAAVDRRGCEMDRDGDGVVDRLDRCPNTRAGVEVDVNGCEIGEAINLPGVNFETNSDRLLPGAEDVLDQAAATLRRNPNIVVAVEGHTDSDGDARYNESLSQRRAETVRDYLIARGVEADRLTALGYGESRPIADNSTATGKAQNRRVVLRVVER